MVTLSFSPQACQILPLDDSVKEVEKGVEAEKA
jgi:hypothetical protein